MITLNDYHGLLRSTWTERAWLWLDPCFNKHSYFIDFEIDILNSLISAHPNPSHWRNVIDYLRLRRDFLPSGVKSSRRAENDIFPNDNWRPSFATIARRSLSKLGGSPVIDGVKQEIQYNWLAYLSISIEMHGNGVNESEN